MKVMIANDGPTAHFFIRMGIARVFTSMGHEVIMWDIHRKPTMDAFDEFEPDIFIGQTYNTGKMEVKAIKERPHMKVIMKAADWGPFIDTTNTTKYPVLTASQQEIHTIRDLYYEIGKPDYLYIHYHPDWIEDTHGHWQEIGIPVHSQLNAADILIEKRLTFSQPLFLLFVKLFIFVWFENK